MATQTTNYNLKKPTVEDFYNVQDQNDNMDILDAQLKANADDSFAKIPKSSATAADQILVSSGVGAWAVKTLAQFKSWLGLGASAYAAIVNNLTTTATGSVLDATQGKALADQIGNISGFSNKTTVFNADCSITENRQDGNILVTVFNSNSSITETLTNGSKVTVKTITFNPDESITEVIS